MLPEKHHESFPLLSKDTVQLKAKIFKHLVTKHWVQYQYNGGWIHVDPWVDFTYHKQSGSTFIRNGRGIVVTGKIDRLHFITGFQENQTEQFDFEDAITQTTKTIPNEVFTKTAESGYDFANAFGYGDWRFNANANLKFGHYKNFIGYGYRSLVLSDFAGAYPHLEWNQKLGKNQSWQVTSSLGRLQSYVKESGHTAGDAPFKVKSFNWTSFPKTWKYGEVGYAQTVNWNRYQGDTLRTSPNAASYVPLPFVYAASKEKSSVLHAINAKAFYADFTLYGQLVLNGEGEQAFQLGLSKWLEYTEVKILVRGELNVVPSSFYSGESQVLAHSHMGQTLAHPLGDGFTETLGQLKFQWKRFQLGGQYVQATLVGGYQAPILGVVQEEPQPAIGGGQDEKFKALQVEFNYYLNVPNKTAFQVGVLQRNLPTSDRYYFVGIRTNIWNKYRDY